MPTPFVNERFSNFDDPAVAAKMQQAIDRVRTQLGRDYPLVIGGKKVTSDKFITSLNPSDPDQVVGRVAAATQAHAEEAMQAALKTFESWRKVSAEDRATVLFKAAKAIQAELLAPPATASRAPGGPLAEELAAVAGFKKAALAVMGVGMLKFGEKLADEQEVMMSMADIIMEVFQAESAVLRAMTAHAGGAANAALHEDAARVFVNDATLRVEASAKQALAAMADGDMLRTHLAALRRLLKWTPVNTVAMRRRLADATVAGGGYLFRP